MLMKTLARIGIVLALLLAASGCSVEGLKAWYAASGTDPAQFTEAELQSQAEAITAYKFAQLDLHKFDWVLNDDQLYRLRWCESSDNYQAVSPGGAYRGAYQFSQSTWNWVAGQHFPGHVGEDPRWAAPEVQDAMARALWSMQGPAPWPVCGYRV
jgi:hypothetical protein